MSKEKNSKDSKPQSEESDTQNVSKDVEKDKESELNRLAEEELMKEAKTLAKIASVEGALGWKRKRIMRTNKLFMQQMIRHTMSSNKRLSSKKKSKERSQQ